MVNRLVSVDDAGNLPVEVQEQLVGPVRTEFEEYTILAQTASFEASSARDEAVAAAESVTVPTDSLVAGFVSDNESNTRVALDEWLSTQGGIGVASILPSGDTTGVEDIASINNALISGSLKLAGGTFYINDSVKIPSNRTLFIENSTLFLVSGSNVPVVRNTNIVRRTAGTANSRIALVGIGRAIIDGNGSGQTNQGNTRNYWLNQGVVFCGVTNLYIENLDITANKGAMQLIGCKLVRGGKIHFNQLTGTVNQDGLDIGPDCSDIVLSGFTGQCQDDCFSFFAKETAWMIPPDTYHGTGQGGDVRDVQISNVNVRADVENCIRLQAADTWVMERVTFNNVISQGPNNLIHLGPTSYSTTPPAPGDFRDIFISNFTHAGGNVLRLSSPCDGIKVSNGSVRSTSTSTKYLITATSFGTDCRNVELSDVQANTAAGNFAVVNSVAGSSLTNCVVNNVVVERGVITDNAGTVTDLRLKDVIVGTATAPVFNSTVPETSGSAVNIKIRGSASGVTTRYAYACRLQLDNTPGFTGSDVLPDAISGSKPLIRWRDLSGGDASWTYTNRVSAVSGVVSVYVDAVRTGTTATGVTVVAGTLPACLRPSEQMIGMVMNQNSKVPFLGTAETDGQVRIVSADAVVANRIRGTITFPFV